VYPIDVEKQRKRGKAQLIHKKINISKNETDRFNFTQIVLLDSELIDNLKPQIGGGQSAPII